MKPVYISIADDLVYKIKEGFYSEGDMLPPKWRCVRSIT